MKASFDHFIFYFVWGLSLYGKVTIITSLLIPKMLYVFSILPTREDVIKQLNSIIYNFLWKGPDKIARLATINDLKHGGLGKPIYYPNYVKAGILFCHHLQFDKDNLQSYNNAIGIGLRNTNFFSLDRGTKCDSCPPKGFVFDRKRIRSVRVFLWRKNR